MKRSRNGSTLFAMIVGLVAISTIMFGLVRMGIRDRAQTKAEFQLEQTYWLLDAGIRQANEKLHATANGFPDRDGEIKFEVAAVSDRYSGYVKYRWELEKRPESDRVQVTVTAELQGRSKYGVSTRRSKEIVLSRGDFEVENEKSSESKEAETEGESDGGV